MSAHPAQGRRLGPIAKAQNRSFDQSSRVRAIHHIRNLQGPLANRIVLKSFETKSEGQNLCWNQRKRSLHPNLDSINLHVIDQVPPVQIQVQMVTVEYGGFFRVEPFYLQGFMAMDR